MKKRRALTFGINLHLEIKVGCYIDSQDYVSATKYDTKQGWPGFFLQGCIKKLAEGEKK